MWAHVQEYLSIYLAYNVQIFLAFIFGQASKFDYFRYVLPIWSVLNAQPDVWFGIQKQGIPSRIQSLA
jgi:hypothetical protein